MLLATVLVTAKVYNFEATIDTRKYLKEAHNKLKPNHQASLLLYTDFSLTVANIYMVV